MKILKFYSQTCGPCKQQGRILEELEGVDIVNVDINDDANADLLDEYKIRSIPTLVILDDNNVATKLPGITPLDRLKELTK
jgi:thioredoxin 1